MKGVKNVFKLLDAMISAETDEDCLNIILARMARENDNLSDTLDLDEARVINLRIKSLKLMSDLIEQKLKTRNHVSIDPQLASEKILKFLTDKIMMSFEELNLGMDKRSSFLKYLQYHLEEWETVKKTVLSDV